jgi:polyribonucleotide nucleotidyltransferase
MAKTFETGHAINVAYFETLILFCVGYGAAYNPSKNGIKITVLNDLLASSRGAIQTVLDGVTVYNNAINDRQLVFEGLKPLSTRLLNGLQVTDASNKTIEDAKGFNRKIQGTRAQKIDLNATPDTKFVSSSQQSFNQQIEHLSKLTSLLQAEPTYNPNETELKTATLLALIANMRIANTNVANAYTNISNARISRNKLLYDENTGLYNTSLEIKKYIKSVFGATSPEYKQISGIKFTSRVA